MRTTGGREEAKVAAEFEGYASEDAGDAPRRDSDIPDSEDADDRDDAEAP